MNMKQTPPTWMDFFYNTMQGVKDKDTGLRKGGITDYFSKQALERGDDATGLGAEGLNIISKKLANFAKGAAGKGAATEAVKGATTEAVKGAAVKGAGGALQSLAGVVAPILTIAAVAGVINAKKKDRERKLIQQKNLLAIKSHQPVRFG